MLELHLPPGQSPPVTRWVVVWGECLENETYCRDQAQATAYATAPGAVIACQVIMIRGGAFGPNLTPTPGFTAALAQRNFNATIAPAIRTATRRAA